MKRKRFTEEQIVKVLQEAEAGIPIKELVRKHGMSEQTFYRWKKKYGGLGVNELRELRHLRKENSRLKEIVADQALDIVVLKDINSKNW